MITMDFNFKIEGLQQFTKLLEELPDDLAKKVYPKAVAKPAGKLRAALKRATPKVTGLTASSFGIFKKRTKSIQSALYGVGPYRRVKSAVSETSSGKSRYRRYDKKSGGRAYKIRRYQVAGWFDTGTKTRRTRKGYNRGRVRGTGYLQRTVDQFIKGGEAARLIARELLIGIQRQAQLSASRAGTRRSRGRRR